jgi:hypothetical protein
MVFPQCERPCFTPIQKIGKIIVPIILIFTFLDGKLEENRFCTKWQQAFPDFNLLLISPWIEFLSIQFVLKYLYFPLSAVHSCLFNILTTTLHTGGRSSIRNLRTRHAMVTGTRLSWLLIICRNDIQLVLLLPFSIGQYPLANICLTHTCTCMNVGSYLCSHLPVLMLYCNTSHTSFTIHTTIFVPKMTLTL